MKRELGAAAAHGFNAVARPVKRSVLAACDGVHDACLVVVKVVDREEMCELDSYRNLSKLQARIVGRTPESEPQMEPPGQGLPRVRMTTDESPTNNIKSRLKTPGGTD